MYAHKVIGMLRVIIAKRRWRQGNVNVHSSVSFVTVKGGEEVCLLTDERVSEEEGQDSITFAAAVEDTDVGCWHSTLKDLLSVSISKW